MTTSVTAGEAPLPDTDGEDAVPVLPDVIVPRSYQLALLEQAKKENIIVYLETGCGKTHIAVMLLQHIADLIRKPSTRIAVFLCPKVYLVQQQAKVVRKYTDLKVGTYYGEMNIDAWKFETWEAELEKNEVFVMTPAILLQNLHHCFMRMDCIELLIFDECHHADKRHPYACIMQEFYHPRSKDHSYKLPRILGMTASPIDGKVDHQGQKIEKELDKIERMLHAKLHTVKEGSDFAPRPLPEFEYYKSTETTNPVTKEFTQSLLNLKNECLKNVLGASRCEGKILGDAYTNVERKTVKNIEKLYNSLDYCGSELGIRCAYEAVNLFLRKYDTDCDTELDVKSEGKEAFLRSTLSVLNSLLSQECMTASCAVPDGLADTHHFSSKVQMLISILERYRDAKDMRCIIFVERKIATRVLASLLSGIKALSSGFRFHALAGKSAGLNVMNRKLQQDVVEFFRDGKVNVLVSTNVAEEGLDIQSCHLVIRFDLPKTPCSFIQSRGRARCLKSTIVYLVERDNNEHLERLEQFKRNEESMKGQVLSRIENFDDVREPETTTIETFEVESTGARISTLCSVSLLHQYCARLAHDSFFTPMPEFSYSEGSWGVKCTVKLPTDALIQTAEGGPTSSPTDAKRVACLAACKRLYEAGGLTDFLLLKSDEDEYPLDAFVPELDIITEKPPSPSHSPSIPDAFSGTWARGLDSIELHAYAVSFEANPNDRAYVNFGLFLEADLGPEAGIIEVQLQLSNRRLVIAKCSPCGTIVFDSNQLGNAKLFQERVFSAVLDHKPGIENSGDWSPDRLYLLLPLREKQESPSLSIDWDSIEKVISDVEYFTLDGVPSEVPGSSLVRLYDGYVRVNHVTNSLVQTMHNTTAKEWLYYARELIHDLTAESPMVMMDPKNSSYSDYFERQHNTRLKFVNQPMLQAKRLKKVRNLLIKGKSPAAEEPREELSGANEKLVELPLELCRIRVKGLSCGLTNAVSLLPSFMHRLEGLLLALQLRRTLPLSHPGASPVPAHLMLEAITTSKCEESFSLEGLELLGDAFLEVSVSERLFLVHNKMQEGKLSKLRTARICNATLERLGRERGIMNYIRDSQFSPEDWAAPGRAHEFSTETIEAEDIEAHPRIIPKRTQRIGTPLQGKTIADVFEALIGAHYIHGDVDAAQAIMGWLGCEVGIDPSIKEEARTRVHGQLGLLSESKVAELEKLLGYKFQNKGLLVEALTHASCLRDSGDCYQRLEFLGDAVLDFLITRHFYKNSEALKRDPGLLTDLRSAAVNNECFARVAVRHNLHVYLLHKCTELAVSVERYVKFVHDSTMDAQCHGWKGDGSPKVLSDLVESLAGAVFLDSDFNLDRVWNVFEKILKPLVTPETLRLEPIRELRELCQKQKFGDPKFKMERGTKGDVLMTVTVQVKNETIMEAGRKGDKKSAKKIAAIQALASLKKHGYEHSLRRLLKRTALYATKFSDLVDVPEGGCHPLASVDEASGALQSEVKDAAATCPADGVGSTSAVFEKPFSPDPSSIGTAQKDIGKRSRAEFASRTVFGSGSVREEQSHVQLGSNRPKDNSKKSDGGDVLIVDTHQPSDYRNSESTSLKESNKTSFSTETDMPARASEPGFNTFHSSSSTSGQKNPKLIETIEFEKLCLAYRASSNTSRDSVESGMPARSSEPGFNTFHSSSSTSGQKTPKLIETIEFEKLCLAYKASSNTSRNSVFGFDKPQQGPLTRDSDVSKTQASSTTTTSILYPPATFSEVALTTDSRPSVVPNEPLVPGGVPKQEPTAAENTPVVTAGASSNLEHRDISGTSQVSSSGNNSDANHQMNGSKQKTPFSDDRVNVDVQSPGDQDHAHLDDVSSTATFVAESLNGFSTYQFNSSVPLSASQPRPPPEMGWQMAKGEARSLLNVLCMKHRWLDPVYTVVWKGGVSHAPLFIYKVQTTVCLGGQAFEIDVEGEVEMNVNGAKDSAAGRLLAWFREQGIPIG